MKLCELVSKLRFGLAVMALVGLAAASEVRANGLDCESFDVVFLVDTSGSIQDEGAVLCNNISAIVAGLAGLGLFVDAHLLSIFENPTGSHFACLTDSVPNLLGTAVPGTPPACCPTLNKREDWAAATAIVAAGFAWLPDRLRVIIPISDEGAEDGDPCEDPGLDRASITNAINVAIANDVIVTPITGNGSSACVRGLADDLAAGTGGSSFASTDPASDLVTAIHTILMNLCQQGPGIIPGLLDFCPADVTKVDPGACGCGVPDSDGDGDSVADCSDNCPLTPNSDQADNNGNSVGDACGGGADGAGQVTPACGCGAVSAALVSFWLLFAAKLARRQRRRRR